VYVVCLFMKRYTDNILKAFATSASLVAVSVFSVLFFNFPLSAQFVLGAALVIYSMFLYGGESHVPLQW
jgi:UDP-sugar transporter A1/2/3